MKLLISQALAAAMLALPCACEKSNDEQGTDAIAQDSDTGELSVNDAKADVLPQADGAAGSKYEVLEPAFVCAPEDATQWVDWVIANHSKLADPQAAPPEVDDKCQPIYDRSCRTICDCKFMYTFKLIRCGFVGVNIGVPWATVPLTGGDKAEGCWQTSCDGSSTPEKLWLNLQCTAGQCYATGPAGLDKLPGN